MLERFTENLKEPAEEAGGSADVMVVFVVIINQKCEEIKERR